MLTLHLAARNKINVTQYEQAQSRYVVLNVSMTTVNQRESSYSVTSVAKTTGAGVK